MLIKRYIRLTYIIRCKLLGSLQSINPNVEVLFKIKRWRESKVLSNLWKILSPFLWTVFVRGQFTVLDVFIRVSETCRVLLRPVL